MRSQQAAGRPRLVRQPSPDSPGCRPASPDSLSSTPLSPGRPRVTRPRSPPSLKSADGSASGSATSSTLFNPQLVVLGGFYQRLFPHLQAAVVKSAGAQGARAPGQMASIVASGLGFDAPLIGAAELALSGVMADPAGVGGLAMKGRKSAGFTDSSLTRGSQFPRRASRRRRRRRSAPSPRGWRPRRADRSAPGCRRESTGRRRRPECRTGRRPPPRGPRHSGRPEGRHR